MVRHHHEFVQLELARQVSGHEFTRAVTTLPLLVILSDDEGANATRGPRQAALWLAGVGLRRSRRIPRMAPLPCRFRGILFKNASARSDLNIIAASTTP